MALNTLNATALTQLHFKGLNSHKMIKTRKITILYGLQSDECLFSNLFM